VWSYDNQGVSGRTVQTTKDVIDATLSGITGDEETVVFIDLGVNEMGSLPTESTWRGNYQYIIDAVHTKWPLALIYITKPWKLNFDSDSAILDGWIDTLVSANIGVCFVADDEAGWFKNNYLTYSADGIHWNGTGVIAKAAQGLTVLGY
jgi:hypothetical protein